MKQRIILFHLLFAFFGLFAQTDTLILDKTNDSTFVEVRKTFDEQGRILNCDYQYHTLSEFAGLLFLETNRDLRAIDDLEATKLQIKKRSNRRKKYIRDSLKMNYDSLAILNLKKRYTGNWRMIVRNPNREVIKVKIREISNPRRLQIREQSAISNRSGTVKIIHSDKIELNSFFDSEKITLVKTDSGVWRGKNGNQKIILRRQP